MIETLITEGAMTYDLQRGEDLDERYSKSVYGQDHWLVALELTSTL